MYSQWSPLRWDRELQRVAARWTAWKGRVASHADVEDDPWHRARALSGLQAFLAVGELPPEDPLRHPLQRWIYRLAEQRINFSGLVTLNGLQQLPRLVDGAPGGLPVSINGTLFQALSDGPRRSLWMSLYADQVEVLGESAGLLWERRAEVAKRMGLESAREMEGCGDGLPAVAKALTAQLRDRVRHFGLDSVERYLEAALGSDCLATWPAYLTENNMMQMFRGSDWFRSLRISPSRLPSPLGSSSFLRALGQLGMRWSQAMAAPDQPFVIANDPYRLQGHTSAALFAGLPGNAAFLQQRLGVGKARLTDARRSLGRVYLLGLATCAIRVQLRHAALSSRARFPEYYCAVIHDGLGLELPPRFAGAFLRPGIEDEQRLAGIVSAQQWQQRLTEEHDEDWFRNPRAVEQLRTEGMRPPRTEVDEQTLRAGVAGLLTTLDGML